MIKRDKPIHPGEILSEEFLKPMGISAYRLAKDTHVAPIRVSHLIRGKTGISAEMALRLARFFSTSPDFWLNIQKRYELDLAIDKAGEKIEQEVKSYAA